MKAAIGLRVHSGWGALVVLAGERGVEEIVARQSVVIVDPKAAGARQPYHFAEAMEVSAAEKHIAKCERECRRLALESLSQVFADLLDRNFAIAGAAILLSSARPLPELDHILASHALIHTAEGEFFRHAFRHALETLKIRVIGIRERDLEECALKTFGKNAPAIHKVIDGIGRSLGPPWTQDQKFAAMAAAIVLAGLQSKVRVASDPGA